ncbi:unnamed protein product [Cyprideis torosa]|uniref:Uncharacterized protein n=1 Tax=Cyprideis torosa TaxID=163714 RepID=A0A7R8ZIX6_9CRUS|nr:unnamed protein product [Cyprideis torosa]CAG0880965.1 unnamed protein product [Cyprideis torosa]
MGFLFPPFWYGYGSEAENSSRWKGNKVSQMGVTVNGVSKEGCFICVVFHQKHPNVIQYKESPCESSYKTVDQLCREISGDAELYSMFRSNGTIPCPFQGPFRFSYHTGNEEWCESPASSVESCDQPSQLRFHFQACSNVKSEASVEDLECVATWRDGSVQYLVGRMSPLKRWSSGTGAAPDDELFRCFVFESAGNGSSLRLSQSAFGSCTGIPDAYTGARVMRMERPASSHVCKFPAWLKDALNSTTWRSLDQKQRLEFGGGSVIHDQGEGESTEWTCRELVDRKNLEDIFEAVIATTNQCDGSYVCLVLRRWNSNVISAMFGTTFESIDDDPCGVVLTSNEARVFSSPQLFIGMSFKNPLLMPNTPNLSPVLLWAIGNYGKPEPKRRKLRSVAVPQARKGYNSDLINNCLGHWSSGSRNNESEIHYVIHYSPNNREKQIQELCVELVPKNGTIETQQILPLCPVPKATFRGLCSGVASSLRRISQFVPSVAFVALILTFHSLYI